MLDTIPLSRPLRLFEGYSTTEIKRKDIPRLRDTRILDWDGKPLSLDLLSGADEHCAVHTVNELQAKLAEGFYAATTLTMRLQGGCFDLARSILDASQLASLPEVSFLDDPYVSVGAFELVPARFVDYEFGENGRKRRAPNDRTTVAQLIADGKCTVGRHEKNRIEIQAGVHCFAMEVLRADLNGDGIQDILVHQGFQVVGGTLSWFESNIFTRKSSTSLLERIQLSFM